jgi:hypothetical protein
MPAPPGGCFRRTLPPPYTQSGAAEASVRLFYAAGHNGRIPQSIHTADLSNNMGHTRH